MGNWNSILLGALEDHSNMLQNCPIQGTRKLGVVSKLHMACLMKALCTLSREWQVLKVLER
jgi:hypothetical protein